MIFVRVMKRCVEWETTRWSLESGGGDGGGRPWSSADRGLSSGEENWILRAELGERLTAERRAVLNLTAERYDWLMVFVAESGWINIMGVHKIPMIGWIEGAGSVVNQMTISWLNGPTSLQSKWRMLRCRISLDIWTFSLLVVLAVSCQST